VDTQDIEDATDLYSNFVAKSNVAPLVASKQKDKIKKP
jgi:hypothetical protein